MSLRSSIVIAALGVLTLPLVARAADDPVAVPIDGEPFRARLVGCDSTWNLQFAVGQARRELPAAELAAWGTFVEPARAVQVLLAGGGVIVADDVDIAEEQLRGTSPTFGKLNLPLELVAGIIFRAPQEAADADKLVARVSDSEARTDRLLLDNGDELTGTITALGGGRAQLQTDGADPWEVKLDTVQAIAFNPALVERPRPSGLRAVVGFRRGDHVTALELVADAKQARLKLAGGVELTAATDSIVALQIFGGRSVYLSDLEPSSYRHIPFLQLSWPYRTDQSVKGSQLRAGGRLYLKGLGMHSPARLTYDLDQPYRRFDAQVAIDDEAGRQGSVVFRVFVDDGSGSWKQGATSAVVRGGEPPVPLSVDLKGVRRISLLVDFADRGDELDHADWLDARLVR